MILRGADGVFKEGADPEASQAHAQLQHRCAAAAARASSRPAGGSSGAEAEAAGGARRHTDPAAAAAEVVEERLDCLGPRRPLPQEVEHLRHKQQTRQTQQRESVWRVGK